MLKQLGRTNAIGSIEQQAEERAVVTRIHMHQRKKYCTILFEWVRAHTWKQENGLSDKLLRLQ